MPKDPPGDDEPSHSSLDDYLNKEFGRPDLESYFKELNPSSDNSNELTKTLETLQQKAEQYPEGTPEYKAAFAEAEEVIARHKDADPSLTFLLGGMQWHQQKFEHAEQSMTEYVKLMPEDPEGWTALASCQMSLEKHAEAEQSYEKSLELTPDMTAHFGAAYAQFQQGKFKAAYEHLEAYTISFPEDPIGTYYLGICALMTDNFPQAETALKKAVELDPQNIETRLMLAHTLSLSGKLEDAEKTTKEFIRLHGNYTPAYKLLGEIFLKQEKYDDAELSFRIYTRMDKKDPAGWYHLGLAQFFRGRFQACEESMLEFTSLQPEHAQAYHYLTLCRISQQKFSQAGKSIKYYAKLSQTDNWLYLAGTHLEKNQLLQAEKCLRQHTKLNPANAEGWLYLTNFHLATGNRKTAYAVFLEAIKHVAENDLEPKPDF